MIIRQNLSGILLSSNRPIFNSTSKTQVGRVYGVVTTENTPTKKQFEKVGGFSAVGTIFYLDYDGAKNIVGDYSDSFLDTCKIAKPFSSDISYPLVGELVALQESPSAASQEVSNAIQTYYTNTINIWNNSQQNAQPAGDSYSFKTFKSNEDIRNLLCFEGDKIIQGRKGNTIRFGSTVKDKANLNEWSSGPGEDGDPIIIITNGHNIDKNSPIHIEKINQEFSSIYFTSTQSIPLITDRKGILNPITNPTSPEKYYGPQLILNSDRIVINSKKDDVLLFATTNIELNTNNVINLNAKERVHINSKFICLGTKNDSLPDEPLVLGIQLVDFLSKLQNQLSIFCSKLSSAVSTPAGSNLIQINAAATKLNEFLVNEMDEKKLLKILSKQNTTV